MILDSQALNLTQDGKITEEDITVRSAFLESYGFVARHFGLTRTGEVKNQICGRCGCPSVYLNRGVLTRGERGDLLVQVEVCCSHCGDLDNYTYWVPEKEVD